MTIDDYDKIVHKEKRLGLITTYVLPSLISFLVILAALLIWFEKYYSTDLPLNLTFFGVYYQIFTFTLVFVIYVPFFFLIYRFKGIKRERSVISYFKKFGFERGVIRHTTLEKLLAHYLILLIVISVIAGFGASYANSIMEKEKQMTQKITDDLNQLKRKQNDELIKYAEEKSKAFSLDDIRSEIVTLKKENFQSDMDKLSSDKIVQQSHDYIDDLSGYSLVKTTAYLVAISTIQEYEKPTIDQLKQQAHNSVDNLSRDSLISAIIYPSGEYLIPEYEGLGTDQLKQQAHNSVDNLSDDSLVATTPHLITLSKIPEYKELGTDQLKQQAHNSVDNLSDDSLISAIIYPSGEYLIPEYEGLGTDQLKQQAHNSVDNLSGDSLVATTAYLVALSTIQEYEKPTIDQLKQQAHNSVDKLSDDSLINAVIYPSGEYLIPEYAGLGTDQLKQQAHNSVDKLSGDSLVATTASLVAISTIQEYAGLGTDQLKQQAHNSVDKLSNDLLKILLMVRADQIENVSGLSDDQLYVEYSKTIREINPNVLRTHLINEATRELQTSPSSSMHITTPTIFSSQLDLHFFISITYIPIAMVYSVFFYKFILTKDKEFEYYLCKGCFKIISNFEQLDDVQQRNYLVMGVKHYQNYIRKNFKMRIKNFEIIVSQIMLLDTESIKKLTTSALEKLDSRNKLDFLNYLNSNHGTNDKSILISDPLANKLKDWGQPLVIPAITGLIAVLKFVYDSLAQKGLAP